MKLVAPGYGLTIPIFLVLSVLLFALLVVRAAPAPPALSRLRRLDGDDHDGAMPALALDRRPMGTQD